MLIRNGASVDGGAVEMEMGSSVELGVDVELLKMNGEWWEGEGEGVGEGVGVGDWGSHSLGNADLSPG